MRLAVGETAGKTCTQSVPSYSQVSPSAPPSLPPKSTVFPRAESYAIANWVRGIGAFAVTTGIGVEGFARSFEDQHDDYRSIMVKSLADRLAEAFAECLHQRARNEWGYGRAEALDNDDLIAERYRGIRPAHGYPACPDHTEKRKLFALLDAPAQGIELTESCAMMPAASVSGLYFAHPAARYFTVGRVDLDQVSDYAQRKNMELSELERWLAPNLGYDPEA